LKSNAFNRFASKRVCVKKGRGEKVCVKAVASKSNVPLDDIIVMNLLLFKWHQAVMFHFKHKKC